MSSYIDFYANLYEYSLKHSSCNSGYSKKYYNKIKLPNGTTRYFYTKEEWDAYNNPKSKKEVIVTTEDNSNAQAQNQQKKNEALSIKSPGTVKAEKAASDPTVKMYVEESKNKTAKELAKDIYKNRDFGLSELFKEAKEAIKDGAMVWDGSDFVSAGDKDKYKQAQEYIDEIWKDMAKYVDSIAKQTGYDSGELWREFRTLTSNKFTRLSNKYGKK